MIAPAAAADEPLPDLIENVRHRFPATRLRAIKSLGKLGREARSALSALVAALDDADPKVREASAAALGQLGTDALPALTTMLSHPDKYVRRHAVWAIGKLGPPAIGALSKLCHSLKDEDPRTASGAAQAIGAMGPAAAEAVPPLAEAMRGTNIVLCRLAAKALSQIGRPAIPTLIAHLRHHDPFVRGEAAVAIGWMGPMAVAAVPTLIDVLRANPTAKAHALAVPIPGLAGTPPTGVAPKPADPPSSEDAGRTNAATALGRIGPLAAQAVPYLMHALSDPADTVRAAADQALALIRDVKAPVPPASPR